MIKKKLDNGITLIIEKIDSKLVTFGYTIKAGSYNENSDQHGMAHLVEHMMFKGTTKRKYFEINKEIESLGGYLNAYTTYNITRYHCTTPCDSWKIAAEVITDMMFNHTIPEEELEKEKKVVEEEIIMYEDSPDGYISNRMYEELFKKYNNRQSIAGKVEEIDSYTREDVLAFIEQHYFPKNMIITIVGDINEKDAEGYIESIIEKNTKNINFVEYDNSIQKFAPYDLGCKTYNYKKLDINQILINFAMLIPGYNNKEINAIKILNNILGGNSTSILYNEIREKLGICYRISTGIELMNDVGVLSGFCGVNKNSKTIIEDITKIVLNFEQYITDESIESAKKYVIGTKLMSTETTDDINDYLSVKEANNVLTTLDNDIDGLEKVTKEQVLNVCKKYFKKENLCFFKLTN